jgi:hypothetical protein
MAIDVSKDLEEFHAELKKMNLQASSKAGSLWKWVWIGLLLVGGALGISKCVESDRKAQQDRENKESIRKKNDADLLAEVLRIKEQFKASMQWIDLLMPNGKRFSDKKIYTKDFEAAYLNGSNTLYFGELDDVRLSGLERYLLTVSTKDLLIDLPIISSHKITYKLECPKEQVDALISRYESLYEMSKYSSIRIAGISNFTKMNIEDEGSGEGLIDKSVVIYGGCLGLTLAPQSPNVIRKILLTGPK